MHENLEMVEIESLHDEKVDYFDIEVVTHTHKVEIDEMH
jgi:hypothetical protein